MHSHLRHIFNIHRIIRVKSELQEIYLNQIIQTFAISLIGIFIPIYLLQLGYTLNNVLFYVLLARAMLGILSPLSASFAARVGLKHTILFRLPISIVFYFLLILLGFNVTIPNLIFIAIIGGLSDCLYWISLNAEFVKNTHKIHGGEEASHLIAFPKLAAIFAPIIGAFILDTLGFDPLFMLVIALLIVSVMPLFATGESRRHFKFKFRDHFSLLLSKKFSIRFFFKGGPILAEHIIWPIYIFMTLHDVLPVGIAAALSGVGISFFTLIVGKLSDKFDRIKMLKAGALAYAFVWFARIYATSMLEIFLLSFLGGIFMTVIIVNLFASFTNFARNKNILSAVTFREIWLTLGRAAVLFILILVALKFQVAFTLAGLMSLLLVLL